MLCQQQSPFRMKEFPSILVIILSLRLRLASYESSRTPFLHVYVSCRKGVCASRIEKLYAETAECSLCYLSNRFLTYTPDHIEGDSGEGPSNVCIFGLGYEEAVCNIHLYARYLYLASVMVDEPSGDGGKWPLVIVIRQVVST